MASEQMNSANLLQLIRETTPGVYNVNGERLVMTSLRGDFAREEAWASFRPSGFNEDAWHAMERTHRVWSGTLRWDFKQANVFLRMLCGAPHSDVTASGKRTRVYTLPEVGPRDLDGATFTLEHGQTTDCERCPYGLLLSISLPAERTSETVEGQVTILCQKPIVEGATMTGVAAANEVQRINFSNTPVSQFLRLRAVGGTETFDFKSDVTTGALKAGIEALVDYQDVTVTVVDNRTTNTDAATGESRRAGHLALTFNANQNVAQIEVLSGEVQRFVVDNGDTGNYAANSGVTFTLGTNEAAFQSNQRALGGNFAAVVTKGTSAAATSGETAAATGGTPSVSTDSFGGASALFDGNNATRWEPVANSLPHWVKYDRGAGNGIAANRYSFRPQAGNYAPKTWQWQGSNDNAAWATLDTKTNQVLAGATTYTYDYTNTTAYRYYRLLITETSDTSEEKVQLQEVSFAVVNATAAAHAIFNAYFPIGVGNVANPAATGTGAVASTVQAGGASADNTTGTTVNQGTSGLVVEARVPMLNRNFSLRRGNTLSLVEGASPLAKAMMMNFEIGNLVDPVWFFDENEDTFQSHIDGGEPTKTLSIRLAKTSADIAAVEADAKKQPAEARWFQQRAVHADDSDYSFRAEFYASPTGAINLGAGGNVRYVEFPLGTIIHGEGFAARFTISEPA